MRKRLRNPKMDANLIIILLAGYWAYKSGILSKILQDVGAQVDSGSGGTGGGGSGGGSGGGGTYSARLQQIVAMNPNFILQAKTWKAERRARGEDPNNWYALRQHLVAIGAPDPGDPAPPEFYSW